MILENMREYPEFISTIAKRIGCNVRTLQRLLVQLEQEGKVKSHNANDKMKTYYIGEVL
jgi:DNA-binding IclR family transcriptional regulator